MDATLILSAGILLGCFIALSWFAGSDAPYVPTKMNHLKKVLTAAGVKKGKKFYELGSGDGRVVFEAAKMGADSVGIEQSLVRVLYSRWKAQRQNRTMALSCQFHHRDIFKINYQHGDIIYIYLLPKGVQKMEEKLKRELKKGAVVITQTFHFKKWKPYKKVLITEKNNPNQKLSKDGKLEGDFWYYRV